MIGTDVAVGARVSEMAMGKRAMAVGQQAKVAVANAKAGGAELPKNAQGVAASAIARGADPASVFAALVAPPVEPGAEDGTMPPTDGAVVEGEASVGEGSSIIAPADESETDQVVAPGTDEGPSIAEPDPGLVLDSAETAFALLEEAANGG